MVTIIRTLGNLSRSPIVRVFAALAIAFWITHRVFGRDVMREIVDGYTIVGCVLVAWRFGPEFWRSLQKPKPQGTDYLIVGIFLVTVAILGLRIMRVAGADLGAADSTIVGYLFGALTTFLVYGVHLKVAAPRFWFGEVWLRPWAALTFSLLGGAVLSAVLLML